MSIGDGYGLWFFVLENLNVILFSRIHTWEAWVTWGILGMFLFVINIDEAILCNFSTEPLNVKHY